MQRSAPHFFLNCFLLSATLSILITGCSRQPEIKGPDKIPPPQKEVAHVGYTIQVGAFRNLENAVRLTRSLRDYDLNAYYFKHESGLYKVRFGDFSSKSAALDQAERMRSSGTIQDFYIVNPDEHAVRLEPEQGIHYLRAEIALRAESYLGIPYQWGGISPENGFDCSGLTMAVYNLVGLNLPRSSRDQFTTGTPISENQLERGDLVFFETGSRGRISHVGIYMGEDRFIHAPGKNKKIRYDSLASGYFRSRFAGARTYLR
jgi:hypothetical protein